MTWYDEMRAIIMPWGSSSSDGRSENIQNTRKIPSLDHILLETGLDQKAVDEGTVAPCITFQSVEPSVHARRLTYVLKRGSS